MNREKIVVDKLSGLFKENNEERNQAEFFFEKIRKDKGFMPTMLNVVKNPNVNPTLRFMALIYLKNFIEDFWEKVPFHDDKEYVKRNILEAISICSGDQRHLKIMLEAVKVLFKNDFPNRWNVDKTLENLKNLLRSNSPAKIKAAIVFIMALTSRFKGGTLDKDNMFEMFEAKILNVFIPILIKLLLHLNKQTISEDIVVMKYMIFKTICKGLHSKAGVYDFLINSPSNFDSFMKLMVNEILPKPNDTRLSWKLRKWIIHCIQYISSKYIPYNEDTMNPIERKFSQTFENRYAPNLVNLYLQLLSRKPPHIPDRVLCLCQFFLQWLIQTCQSIFLLFSKSIDQVFEAISKYTFFRPRDKEMWENSPQEFEFINFDVGMSSFTAHEVKIVACTTFQLLMKMQKFFPNVGLSLKLYNKLVNRISSGNISVIQKDGYLYILGNCAKYLIQNQGFKNNFEKFIYRFVLPDLRSPLGFVRARACWICGKYSSISWPDKGRLVNIFRGLIEKTKDQSHLVRIQAGISVCDFLQYETCMSVVRNFGFGRLLQHFILLLQHTESETLVHSIELLIDSFGETANPHLENLMNTIAKKFWQKYDNYIKLGNMDQGGDGNDDNDELDAENAHQEFLMFALLKLIGKVISVTKPLKIQQTYFRILYPLISKVIHTEDAFEFLEQFLDILSSMTYHLGKSGIFPDPLWLDMFPKIYQTFMVSGGVTMSSDFEALIDNYISYGTKLITPQRIKMILDMCYKLLGDQDRGVYHELNSHFGCNILSCLLQNLKGKLDSFFPKMMGVLVYRLLDKNPEEPSFCILLMNSIADSFHYNPLLAMNTLNRETKGNTQKLLRLFQIWFTTAKKKFYRTYDRKVTILGCVSLIGLVLNKRGGVDENTGMTILLQGMNTVIEMFRLNRIDQQKKIQKDSMKEKIEKEVIQGITNNTNPHLKRTDFFWDVVKEIHNIGGPEIQPLPNLEEAEFDSPILKISEVELFRSLCRTNMNNPLFNTIMGRLSLEQKNLWKMIMGSN